MSLSFAAASAVCGALAGELTRRQLTPVRYRRAGVEQGLPDPGARYWVTFTAGLALASLGGVLLPARWHLLILYAPVAVGATWLSAVDLDVRRLPDNVALPLLGWAAVGVPVVAMMTPNVSSLAGLAGAVGLGGFLWVLNIASAGKLGFGDVKAGALTGLLVGSRSLPAVWWLGMIAFLAALVAAYVPRRRSQLPMGPFLFASWLLVTVAVG